MYAKLSALLTCPQISHWSLCFSFLSLLSHSFFRWQSPTPAQWIRTTHSHIIAFPLHWRNVRFFLLLLIGLASMLPQPSPLFLRRRPPLLGFLYQGVAGSLLLHLRTLTKSSSMDGYLRSLGLIYLGGFHTSWSPWWNPKRHCHNEQRLLPLCLPSDSSEANWAPVRNESLQKAYLASPSSPNFSSHSFSKS